MILQFLFCFVLFLLLFLILFMSRDWIKTIHYEQHKIYNPHPSFVRRDLKIRLVRRGLRYLKLGKKSLKLLNTVYHSAKSNQPYNCQYRTLDIGFNHGNVLVFVFFCFVLFFVFPTFLDIRICCN